jgi:hypothetical protein
MDVPIAETPSENKSWRKLSLMEKLSFKFANLEKKKPDANAAMKKSGQQSPRQIKEIKMNLRQHAMKRETTHACISLGVLFGEDIPMAVINIIILSKTISKAFDCNVGDASTATWDSTKVIMISLALSMFMIGQKASLVEKIKYVVLYSSTMVMVDMYR